MREPSVLECSWEHPVEWFLFPQGVYLDLGIVRDSQLNSTNNFQMFGESFEVSIINHICENLDPNCLFTIDLRD